MPLPLEGIRVLDWTIWQQGPVCSAMLGDMGAHVIKIEQRGTGDPGRYIAAVGGKESSDRPNWYFEANNRNKQSIGLDLKKPEGRAVVLELARQERRFRPELSQGGERPPGSRLREPERSEPQARVCQRHGLRTRGTRQR